MCGLLRGIAKIEDGDDREFEIFQLAQKLGGPEEGRYLQVNEDLLGIVEVLNASDIAETVKEYTMYKSVKGILS